MSKQSSFLADLVFVFHCLIVAFVILAPFTNNPAILIVHITFGLCLIVHWFANSNTCSLTLLEANLRGIKITETVSQQFVGPMYDVSASEWSNIVWIVTMTVMCISMYKLYNNVKFKESWKCYKDLKSEDRTFTNIVVCFRGMLF